jgi:hypothetical protein
MTCGNPARYAKGGQFDTDSTQHALAAALTSLELQGCKFLPVYRSSTGKN